MTPRRGAAAALFAALWLVAPTARAFPVYGDQSVLPSGTELGQDELEVPVELFRSEVTGGKKSYLINLGDLAFTSPSLLGGVARRAGVSCDTCHVNGAGNPKLFIPGLSSQPGNFDTTNALFHAKADNGVLDPLTPPSLRGARGFGPYGHDGRTASLRDFVENAITNEFGGPEPSSLTLDAIVAYIQDIAILPNPRLGPGGRLTDKASAAERRGEALFARPFPHAPGLSCAACHMPSAGFVDHVPHDVGTGGLYKTPTLLDANFNAPYFHDGRYHSYDEVVAHFDRVFALGFSAAERDDLVAYLSAVGDGEQPYEPDGVAPRLKEIADFSSVLAAAIPEHDVSVIALAVDTVGGELREFTERFPDRKDSSVAGGREERGRARIALKELVLSLRRIEVAASSGDFDSATAEYADYSTRLAAVAPVLDAAVPWSLFNPAIHAAHFAALRQLVDTAKTAR